MELNTPMSRWVQLAPCWNLREPARDSVILNIKFEPELKIKSVLFAPAPKI